MSLSLQCMGQSSHGPTLIQEERIETRLSMEDYGKNLGPCFKILTLLSLGISLLPCLFTPRFCLFSGLFVFLHISGYAFPASFLRHSFSYCLSISNGQMVSRLVVLELASRLSVLFISAEFRAYVILLDPQNNSLMKVYLFPHFRREETEAMEVK